MSGRRLSLVLAALCAAGCSESAPPAKIDGLWRERGGEDNTLSFNAGGEFRQLSHGTRYTGTWKHLSEDRVEVTFGGESARLGTIVLAVSFDKGALITRNPAGRLQQWIRP